MLKKLFMASIILLTLFATSVYANACIPQKPQPCSASTTADNCLFQLIHQRECLMQAVAADKYLHHGDVYDAAQEKFILLNVAKNAVRYHLNVAKLQVFSQIQMDVSKQIEAYWIQYWQTNHVTPTQSISLAELRQSIQLLDNWTLAAIIQALPMLHDPNNSSLLSKKIGAALDIKGTPKNPNYPLILLGALTQVQ